jgi:hypothetical protein
MDDRRSGANGSADVPRFRRKTSIFLQPYPDDLRLELAVIASRRSWYRLT